MVGTSMVRAVDDGFNGRAGVGTSSLRFVLVGHNFREDRAGGREGVPATTAQGRNRLVAGFGVIFDCVHNEGYEFGAVAADASLHLEAYALEGFRPRLFAVLCFQKAANGGNDSRIV